MHSTAVSVFVGLNASSESDVSRARDRLAVFCMLVMIPLAACGDLKAVSPAQNTVGWDVIELIVAYNGAFLRAVVVALLGWRFAATCGDTAAFSNIDCCPSDSVAPCC